MKVADYCWNLAIAVDQLANTIIGGYPDETISSRVYRYSKEHRCANVIRIVLDLVFRPWGANHCQEAFESELERNHLFETSGLNAKFRRCSHG